MKQFVLLLLAAASSRVAAENVIDFTKLPTCAKQQCAILQQADANCVPPAAPVTNQGIYQSCVCESALLTGLRTSGQLCQAMGCSADDATKISQYYVALCAGPVVQPAPTTIVTTTTTTNTNPPTGDPTAGGAAGNPTRVNQGEPSWISGHWKWIVMVVVIALAMAFFWIGGIYLRRHFERKKDAERANLAAKEGHSNGSTTNTSMPPPEMSGGRDGSGNFVPPMPVAPVPTRMRSRTNTLRSSRTSLPQPVVWGPHQHLANTNGRNSPGVSGPPSPTSATQSFRNREAMRSMRSIHSFRASSSDMNNPPPLAPPATHNANYTDTLRHPHTSHGPADATRGSEFAHHTETEQRPYTALGDPIRENHSRRTMNNAVHNGNGEHQGLSTHLEGQSAEICDVSPQKSVNSK